MIFSLSFQKHGSWISDNHATAAERLASLCVQKLRNIQFSLCFVRLSGETSDSAQFARIEVQQQPKLAATVRYFHVKQSGAARLLPLLPPSPSVQVYYVSISSIRTSAAKEGRREDSKRREQSPQRERRALKWEIVVFGILAKYHLPSSSQLPFLRASALGAERVYKWYWQNQRDGGRGTVTNIC